MLFTSFCIFFVFLLIILLGEQIIRALKRHYSALRQTTLLRQSTILYVLENNLGREHEWIINTLNRDSFFENFEVLQELDGIKGFRTTTDSKLRADDFLRECVSLDGLAFMKDIISVNDDPSRTGDAAKEMLIEQLEGMKEYTKPNPNGTTRRFITSIFSSEFVRIRGRKDDIQRALSMLIYAARMFVAKRLPVSYEGIQKKRFYRPPEFITARKVHHSIMSVAGKKRSNNERY